MVRRAETETEQVDRTEVELDEAPLSEAREDALTFYSHITGFRFDHLEVAKRVFSGLRKGSFVELDLRSVDLLRLGFGASHHELVTKA